MKKHLSTILFLLLMFIVVFYFYIGVSRPFDSQHTRTVIVMLPEGTSATRIYDILENAGLVRGRLFFKILIHLKGYVLKAGEYELSPSLSMNEIVAKLARGENINHKITIPEGFTLLEIAELLDKSTLGDSEKFLKLCNDAAILNKYNIPAKSMEGYIFPETYNLPRGMGEEKILDIFWSEFKKRVHDHYFSKAGEDPEVLHTKLILASIVEGEAQTAEERPAIARVFLNRLKKRMKLESCATIQYALGERKKRLFEEDLKVESPYNTYRYRGLPPGPIGSPGLASIEAAFAPDDNDFLYFVSKKDGTHAFSHTLKEHNSLARKFLGR